MAPHPLPETATNHYAAGVVDVVACAACAAACAAASAAVAAVATAVVAVLAAAALAAAAAAAAAAAFFAAVAHDATVAPSRVGRTPSNQAGCLFVLLRDLRNTCHAQAELGQAQ